MDRLHTPNEFFRIRRNMAANGLAVLRRGLPALPAELNHHMAAPMVSDFVNRD